MALWRVTVGGTGIRKATVEKLAAKYREEFGDGAYIQVTDASPPESRSERFAAAMSDVSDARGEVEALRDELQEWRDGMPENLQSGSKAGEIDDAIGNLEEVIQNLESVEGSDVSFPSMMG